MVKEKEELYNEPRAASKHFRLRRDDLVKRLNQAAHINGSQFVLLCISPLGYPEVYASKALEQHAANWITKDIKQEAIAISVDALERRTGGWNFDEMPSIRDLKRQKLQSEAEENPEAFSTIKAVSTSLQDREQAPVLVSHDSSDSTSSLASASTASTTAPCGIPKLNAAVSAMVFHVERDLLHFYIQQFSALHQDLAKRLAKQWIKVIEPQKLKKYPYYDHANSKPPWWPHEVRHERPDHLLKAERAHLLGALLLKQLAPVSKLEESAAEWTISLPTTHMRTLSEIYYVALKDESLRKSNKGLFTLFAVNLKPNLTRSLSIDLSRSTSTEQTHLADKISPVPSLDAVASSLNLGQPRKRRRTSSPFTPALPSPAPPVWEGSISCDMSISQSVYPQQSTGIVQDPLYNEAYYASLGLGYAPDAFGEVDHFQAFGNPLLLSLDVDPAYQISTPDMLAVSRSNDMAVSVSGAFDWS